MVSQAETIKDSIETQWALTGELNKTSSNSMKEVVRFFARKQVEGNEWPKAVTVEKINDETDENKEAHPKFNVVSDVYKISVHYRVLDVEPTTYETALTNIEDMGREVQRILALTYQPSSATGTFFTIRHRWANFDQREEAQTALIRTLTFELTQITSDDPEVFRGYGGVLVFSKDLSVGDSLPVASPVYAEAYNVELNEGYETISYLTNDITEGVNVPQLATGEWNGEFTMNTMMKKSDVSAATMDALDNIYRTQTSAPLQNELGTVVLIQNDSNTEGTPVILTTITYLKVNNVQKISDVEQLVKYSLSGRIIKPTIWGVS